MSFLQSLSQWSYSNNACASCDDGCCNYVSCIYTMDDGCKKYDCLSPENCASLGGENHGKHNHHSGALAWSTGVAAVTVAASTVAFL